MFKKISIIVSSVFLLSSITLFATKALEPTKAISPVTMVDTSGYNELKTTAPNTRGNSSEYKFLFFCSPSDEICKYISDDVINKVALELNVDSLSFLEYVNMDENYQDITPVRLKSLYGIESYPAFVALQTNGSSNKILNTLEYDSSKPFTIIDFKKWLALNNLYDGFIEQAPTGELIDEPAQ